MKRTTLVLLFTVAIAVGLVGGLLYTWVLEPVEYYDATPDSLHIRDKFVYATLIGDLYAYEEDLAQAKARLATLKIEADGSVLADIIEQYLEGSGRPEEMRNLAHLAQALGASGGVLLVFGANPTAQPSSVPSPPVVSLAPAQTDVLLTSPPTLPPTRTPIPGFQLVEQAPICSAPGRPGTLAIRVQDAEGNEVPGTEIVVSWPAGQDRFFTGLRPERGAGYADFEMEPAVEYSVALAGFPSDVVQELTSALAPGTCPTGTIALSWKLTFQQTQ
jgi:hypothetical protein